MQKPNAGARGALPPAWGRGKPGAQKYYSRASSTIIYIYPKPFYILTKIRGTHYGFRTIAFRSQDCSMDQVPTAPRLKISKVSHPQLLME